jgi:4-hydroxy-4-methyl-2-oxoglutarate aldolase
MSRSWTTGAAVTAETLDELRRLDTCTVSNAIERFGVRLRNAGFTRPGGLRQLTGEPVPLIGYAATLLMKSSEPPMAGNHYLDRTDWWESVGALPLPRLAVIQDLEAGSRTSTGSTAGEVHAAILKALGCQGVITDGAVRDVPAVGRMGFALFARFPAVSHSYAHVVDYGSDVEIFGLAVHYGDLVMADCHGAVSIPVEIAPEVPRVAGEIRARERRIIAVCQSPDFSLEKLSEAVRSTE